MTNEQLLAKYNPANAHNLSQIDIEGMKELTTDQIKVLAEAYPNNANRKPYLILFDNNVKAEKQLYPLSTWQNLYNVRKFSSMKNLVPHTFKELFTVARPSTNRLVANRATGTAKSTTSPRKVIDLSADEAANELKKNLPPVRTMTAKTSPEPEADKKLGSDPAGTEVVQPAKKAATSRATKKADAKKATETVKANDETLPADQQLADIDEVTDTNVGDIDGGKKEAGQ